MITRIAVILFLLLIPVTASATEAEVHEHGPRTHFEAEKNLFLNGDYGSASTSADGKAGYHLTDEEQVFLQSLKDAIANDDRAWVAGHVFYPIKAYVKGRRLTIRNRTAFLAHYDQIMNRVVQLAVLREEPDTTFKNWHGSMVHRGELWFDLTDVVYACDASENGMSAEVHAVCEKYGFGKPVDLPGPVQIIGINNNLPFPGETRTWWDPARK